jgi:hypothetical protein
MKEYGIEELSLSKMIKLSYDLLQQQSFFTVGEDEVRAWTCGAARRQSRRQAKSTPTYNAALCAPKWWLVRICFRSGGMTKPKPKAN